MIQQGFFVGNHKWYVMCAYDICTDYDKYRTCELLLASGCPKEDAEQAIDILSNYNSGFTYSNLNDRLSIMLCSHATSAEQMYDTIQHELKHIVEHISDYYKVSPKSEDAAYLQGEIARQMFPAAALLVCPKCNC